MITSAQVRAARAFLRWSALDLAQKTGIGVATIRRIDMSEGVPSSNAKTLDLIQKVLESEGIEFVGTPENSPGVRFSAKIKDK
ncbi:MAG: transcriptional regulator [Betaproteobacteria bacterium]|nr:transcriptional regulator [Betaproteobacteria bacterium]